MSEIKNMENKMENQNPVPETGTPQDANPKKVGFFGTVASCIKKGFNWVIEIPTRHPYAAEFVTFVCSMAAGGAAMVYTMDKVSEHDKKKASAMPAATNKPIIDVTATAVEPTPVQIPEIDVAAPVSEVETVEPVQFMNF